MDSPENSQEGVYHCDDGDLGGMLHRLFQEGAEEVEINHPVDGPQVITKAEFYRHVEELGKAAKMSPAEKLMKRKQLEKVAAQKRIRFRTAMITADVATIDVDGDNNFGYDVEGNKLDIDGMIFVAATDYLDGIELKPGELGCMVDEQGDKPPLRLVAA